MVLSMLYTVIPLEQIYRNGRRANDIPSVQAAAKEIEYKEVLLPHGRIVARRDGDNHIVERVVSTNMEDYLNVSYHPGKVLE